MSNQPDDLRILKDHRFPGPSPDCPQEDRWYEVAGGLLDNETERQLLDHASQCGHCGPLLREASATLSADATPEEEAMLAAAPALVSPAAKPPASAKPFWRPWLLVPAAALFLAGIVLLTRHTEPDSRTLLTRAYSSWRTFEFRMPDAAHAKYAPVKLSGESDSTARPVAVQEALASVARHLEATPADPEWLLAQARLQLLLGESATAIRSFERLIARLTPGRLRTQAQLELAAAFYEDGRRLSRSEPIGRAFDLLSDVLKEQPKNAVALFNRALCAEALEMPRQAIEDWEAFLAIESSGGWATEARERLQKVRAKAALIVPPPSDPAAFLALQAQGGLLAAPERFMDIASFQWLPRLRDSQPAQAAAALLARQLVERHNDPWLRDLLAHPSARTEAFRQAAASMAASAAKTALGDGTQAVELARQAVAAFEKTGNTAAVLRARTALVYAISRSLKSPERVLDESARLDALAGARCAWCQVQTTIERVSAYQSRHEKDRAAQTARQAARLAQSHQYEGLYVRAASFEARSEQVFGRQDRAWTAQVALLAKARENAVVPLRAYQLMSDLSQVAELSRLPATAHAYAREASALPDLSANQRTFAFALLRRGVTAEPAGHPDDARTSLARASTALQALPTMQVSWVDSELLLADLDLGKDHHSSVLNRLQSLGEPRLPRQQVRYLRTLGLALYRAGRGQEASEKLRASVAAVRAGSRSIATEAERIAWLQEASSAYRGLVDQQLRAGNIPGAFALWQEFHYTGSDGPQSLTGAARPGAVLLSYVELAGRLGVFVASGQSVEFRWLDATVAEAGRLGRLLVDLCSTPDSSLAELRPISRRLHQALIEPVAPQLAKASALTVEPDDLFASLPFGALLDANGHYLQQTHSLSYSFGASRPAKANPSPAKFDLLLAWNASGGAEHHVDSPEVRGMRLGLQRAHKTLELEGDRITADELRRQLPAASLFYFIGHGVNHGGLGGLVLAGNRTLDAGSLHGLQLPRAPVVFLASCSTASGGTVAPGKGDSLIRAFQTSGASAVVASRWSAELQNVTVLLSHFDEALRAGQSPAQALHRATSTLREKEPHPYHWASFSLFGALDSTT